MKYFLFIFINFQIFISSDGSDWVTNCRVDEWIDIIEKRCTLIRKQSAFVRKFDIESYFKWFSFVSFFSAHLLIDILSFCLIKHIFL